jgi:ubiquinone/menaquinone biosynthesis C-methylase UbiE
MSDAGRSYLPAAGRDIFLPLYDPIVKLLGAGAARAAVIAQAGIRPRDRVFDLGCGTGTLAIEIKKRFPEAEIIGLDPDPKALVRARRKAAREALAIHFDQGFGNQLPYAAASFDRAFSSFMFHHLPAEEKANTLREVRRVLKPGGEFHMMDFEAPEDHQHGFVAHLLRSHAHLKDNSAANVLAMFKDAGFREADKAGRRRMIIFGAVAYYRALA